MGRSSSIHGTDKGWKACKILVREHEYFGKLTLPSSTEVKERVELYHYSPSVPSWPLIGRTLRFTFTMYKILSKLFCTS